MQDTSDTVGNFTKVYQPTREVGDTSICNAIAGSCSILLGRPAPQGSERAFLNVPRSGHCQLLLILLLDLHKVMRVELNSTGSAVADRCRSDGGPPGTSVSRVTGAAFCHACPDEAGTLHWIPHNDICLHLPQKSPKTSATVVGSVFSATRRVWPSWT